MKILVADESLYYRKVLQTQLESSGYEVLLAVDGYEAQRVLDGDDAPRLAILNCIMPGVSGFELCERIRARKQGYVYTILLSADTEQSDVLHGFEFGADDYLCKPINPIELRTRLKVGEIILRSREELAEAREALKFEASHDSLLRIWNRGAIIELLGKELSRAKRSQTWLSVLLADLDFFKRMDDNHGHLVGDDVLRDAVERVSGAVRTCDHVGRYDDEQFLVILPNCTSDAAREVAERVRKCIGDEPILNDIETGVSIGVSQWHSGQDIRDVLHYADLALHRAKQNGGIAVENAYDGEHI
jgi:diguanylate cyclase (GGDEF)-like protein